MRKNQKESSQGSGGNLHCSSRKPATAAAFRKQLQTAARLLFYVWLHCGGFVVVRQKIDSSVDPIEFTGLGLR